MTYVQRTDKKAKYKIQNIHRPSVGYNFGTLGTAQLPVTYITAQSSLLSVSNFLGLEGVILRDLELRCFARS